MHHAYQNLAFSDSEIVFALFDVCAEDLEAKIEPSKNYSEG